MVANYPLDGYPDGSLAVQKVGSSSSRHLLGAWAWPASASCAECRVPSVQTKSPSEDDAAFMHLASVYAQLHKTMAQNKVGVR